jgi:hypothetical protein
MESEHSPFEQSPVAVIGSALQLPLWQLQNEDELGGGGGHAALVPLHVAAKLHSAASSHTKLDEESMNLQVWVQHGLLTASCPPLKSKARQ